MLNEIYDLSRALDNADIRREIRAEGLEEGRRQEGIRVFLNAEGRVSRFEHVSAEHMKRICKWSSGAGQSLPVYNLDSIFALQPADLDRLRKAWVAAHRTAQPFSELHPPSSRLNWPTPSGKRSRTKDLNSALTTVSQQVRTAASNDFADGGDAWKALLERLGKVEVLSFVSHLGEELAKWVRTGLAPKCAFDVLYCSEDRAEKPTKTPIQLEPEGVFDAPIYSAKVQQWLTKARQNYANTKVQPATGQKQRSKQRVPSPLPPVWGTTAGCTETFLPVDSPIGQISFFNKDVGEKPTSARYDADLSVFPVGADKRTKFISDLKWLMQAERKGKTWTKRFKPNQDDPFLLLTYLDEKADTPAGLADLFAGPAQEESDRAIVQFETICTGVIKAFDAIPALSDQAKVTLFALHKPDPGRTQIFCSKSFTATALKKFAVAWQTDCRKHPAIMLPQFPLQMKEEWQQQEAAGIKPQWRFIEPAVPFPYQAVECLNTIWQKCEDVKNAKADPARTSVFRTPSNCFAAPARGQPTPIIWAACLNWPCAAPCRYSPQSARPCTRQTA